jgi:hypothetical protein
MNTDKLTWKNDIRAALNATGHELNYDPAASAFNDKNISSRRIKFYLNVDFTDADLQIMQQTIQSRRPELNVTVSRWNGLSGHYGSDIFGNVVVYYRPKVGNVLHPDKESEARKRQEVNRKWKQHRLAYLQEQGLADYRN